MTREDEAAVIKSRRKALGWSRAELADRAGIDRRVVQLVELDQWDDAETHARIRNVLGRAEQGEAHPRLAPPKLPHPPESQE